MSQLLAAYEGRLSYLSSNDALPAMLVPPLLTIDTIGPESSLDGSRCRATGEIIGTNRLKAWVTLFHPGLSQPSESFVVTNR
jgi:hypothetical protein